MSETGLSAFKEESDNEDCNYRCGQYGRSRCPWFGKGKLGQDIGYHGVQSQSGVSWRR